MTVRIPPTAATVVAALIVLSLVAGGCGTDGEVQVAAEPTATEVPEPTPEPVPTPTGLPEPTPTEVPPTVPPTVEPEPTAPPPEPTADDLPGEPFDFLVPQPGQIVGVVGVAHDDILELHELPGELTPLVAELPNQARDLIGTGQGRLLPQSIWWRVEWQGHDGWAGSRFMAYIGDTIDFTSHILDLADGQRPAAETMLDLGNQVADLVKSDDPPSRIVVSGAPTVGDLGEITMDVVGMPDDAVYGYRLHIFGQPIESGEGFELRNVETTLLCRRGVSDGLCL